MTFEPDLVILQFVLNDVVEPFKTLRRYGGEGIDYHKVEDVYWLHHWLSQKSALYLLLADVYREIAVRFTDIEEAREKALEKAESLDWNLAAREPANETEKMLWAETLKQLQNIVDLCKEYDIPVLLLASPVQFQLYDPNSRYAQETLKRFAASNGIAYHDVLPALDEEVATLLQAGQLPNMRQTEKGGDEDISRLVASSVWDSYFLDYDHYNPDGHRFVAEQIYPKILDLLSSGAGLNR
jgi:lysophospholipase L1-like esterase